MGGLAQPRQQQQPGLIPPIDWNPPPFYAKAAPLAPAAQLAVFKMAGNIRRPKAWPEPPWPFQAESSRYAAQFTSVLSSAGFVGEVVAPMIRATLIDKDVFRQLGATGVNRNAWIAVLLTILIPSVYLLPRMLTLRGFPLITALLLPLLGPAMMAKAIAYARPNRKDVGDRLFRALAFAQAPAALAILPIIGGLLALWVWVAQLAAIRDILEESTWDSFILLLVGWVGSAGFLYLANLLLVAIGSI